MLRKSIFLLAIALMLASPAFVQAQSTNLVENPGFELGASGWTFSADPNLGMDVGTCASPCTVPRSGATAAFKNLFGGGAGTLRQTIPTIIGRPYRVTVWIAGNSFEAGTITVSLGSTAGVSINDGDTALSYSQFTFDHIAATESEELVIGGNVSAGTFFFDDVSVVDLDAPLAECEDSIDNDLDGFIDFPADAECDSASDNDEASDTANLISNPGFEQGPTSWIFSSDPGLGIDAGTCPTPCTVPLTGSNAAFKNLFNGGAGTIRQIVSTTPGSTYEITVGIARNSVGAGNVTVSFGSTTGVSVDQTDVLLTYATYSFTHTATTISTEFSFGGLVTGGTFFLDDVSVVDVGLQPAQCEDGRDNDSDGLIDFPADPGCDSATDIDETDDPVAAVSILAWESSFTHTASVRISNITGTRDTDEFGSDVLTELIENLSATFATTETTLTHESSVVNRQINRSGVAQFVNGGGGTGTSGIDISRLRILVSDAPTPYSFTGSFSGTTSTSISARLYLDGGPDLFLAEGNDLIFDGTGAFQGALPPGLYRFEVTTGLGTANANVPVGGESYSFAIALDLSDTSQSAQCEDGLDNDGDGLIDFPDDPGCDSATDNDEFDTVPAQCEDGLDNDGDGLIDFPDDPGCDSATDNDEFDTVPAQCEDGLDNDGDGLIDFPEDPGCDNSADDDEFNAPPPQCADGIDNDADGLIDFPADTGCSSLLDDDESGELLNLVVNPSFELGPIGWTFSNDPALGVDVGTCAAPCVFPRTGENAAFKNFLSGGAGTVSQSVPTIPGNTYIVTAGLAINGSANGDVTISFGATPGVSVSETDLATSYAIFSFTHVATTLFTDFVFAGTVTGGTFFLDDILVVDTSVTLAQCEDGVDNDDDGLIDFPADPDCSDSSDNIEGPLPDALTGNLIDFNSRADGTPFMGPFEIFPADEYASLGVVLNDSDLRPGQTLARALSPAEEGGNFAGYFVGITAFAGIRPTFLTADLLFGSREVSFDFANVNGLIRVLAFDAADNPVFDQVFTGSTEFGVGLAGSATVDAGQTMYRIRIESPPVFGPPGGEQVMFVENLRVEAAIPDSADIAGDVVFGTGVVIGENVTVRRGSVIGDNVEIGDNAVIRRNVQIGSNTSIGAGAIIAAGTIVPVDTLIGAGSRIRLNVVLGESPVIGEGVSLANSVQLGDRVIVNSRTVLRAGVVVGNDVVIGFDTILRRSVAVSDRTHIGDNVVVRQDARIGVDARIGNNVIIRANSTIPDGSVVPEDTVFP